MDSAFKAVIEQLGVGGALFVIACLVIAYLYKQNSELHKQISDTSNANQEDREVLQEKRLEEAKQLLVIIERNNANASEVSKSVASMTTALNELVKGFASMVQNGDLNRERFRDQANRIEQGLTQVNKAFGDHASRIEQSLTQINKAQGGNAQ